MGNKIVNKVSESIKVLRKFFRELGDNVYILDGWYWE